MVKQQKTIHTISTVDQKPSHSSKVLNRRFVTAYVLVLIILVLCILTGALIKAVRTDRARLSTLASTVALQQVQSAASANYALQSRVTVSVADNVVYFPELHIKLPLTDASLGLLYSVRSAAGSGKAQQVTDVTTMQLANSDPGTIRTVACVPLRLAFETKSDPYNPHEKNVANVTLADGRVLQAYAFHHPQCDQLFHYSGTDPDALGALFKQAQSY